MFGLPELLYTTCKREPVDSDSEHAEPPGTDSQDLANGNDEPDHDISEANRTSSATNAEGRYSFDANSAKNLVF